jgi:uncharacterized protein DUF6049
VTAAAFVLLTLLGAVVVTGLGVLGPGVGPALAAAAAPRDPSQPLVLKMRSITPDYVPEKGPIVIRGTVTNASGQEWTAINVHGFISDAPMTTAAELTAATRTPLSADVGSRITVPGTFDHIDSLQPGESQDFVVRLPRSTLGVSTPGVYWFGVHVLGDNGEGGSRVAVGRDRTFLPLVPQATGPDSGTDQVDTALVVPVRSGVVRGSDGAVEDPQHWARSLRSGALHDAVRLGTAAGSHSVTWMVDPAVTDTVRDLARGNPPRSLGSPTAPPGGDTTSPSPSPSATESSTGTSAVAATSTDTATQRLARRWLHSLHRLLAAETGEVVGLPYGDVAVESAATYDRPLLGQAIRHTGSVLRPWGLPLRSVSAPPTGRSTGDVVAGLPPSTAVLLHDTGVRGPAPTVDQVNGRRVVLLSSGAAEGGPGPVDPQSPLALRQRILSEAALRYLGDRQPLVVVLPTGLHHRIGSSFFSGLDVPWLRLTTLDGATAVPPSPLSATRLRAPADDTGLGPRIFADATQMLDNARTLQSVLPGNHELHRQLFEETTGNTSYASAADPFGANARVRSTARWVSDNLGSIDLSAPESVTLASASGHFSALVSNDLDVPVTVKLRAVSDPALQITGGETVQLPPNGRTTVLLNASTHVLGVHTVTLELTNSRGRPLGATDQFPMRAEQVSRLIWVIIGAGVALLFAAIVVRLTRRILRARAGRAAPEAPDE